jgi:cytochrome c oxidase subunit 4
VTVRRPERNVPILPARTFLLVWAALLALTAATVAIAKGGLLGGAGVLAALGIASLKAGLVLAFFMHLRYESRLLQRLALLALLTLLTILAGTFADVWYR